MRPIHVVRLDKARPAVFLTRERALPHMRRITVAPVTTRIRGLTTEVPVGQENGLHTESVVSCDNISTVYVDQVGALVGYLLPHQERQLARAIAAAFDLDVEW
jgi:mRNA interferase MazF